MTPKIFIYCYGTPVFPGDVAGAALSEDGLVLASHISSDPGWSRIDLQRPAARNAYAAYYPDGSELVWLGYEPDPAAYPEFAAAVAANEQRVAGAQL